MAAADLSAALSRVVDPTLAKQLVKEVTEIEEAFALRRWKYTELDGGRFAEVAARIIYGVDSGDVNLSKSVDDCLRYVDNDQVSHAFPGRQGAVHISKVIRAIYKLRSQRGAVHVSPTYTANELDSRLIVESVRWVFAEILRIFVTSDPSAVATIVQELSRFPHPLIRYYGGMPLLQSVNFTVEEEVLIHLLHDRAGLSTAQIVKIIPRDPSGVRRAIKRLADPKVRQITRSDQCREITDIGIARIEARMIKENVKLPDVLSKIC